MRRLLVEALQLRSLLYEMFVFNISIPPLLALNRVKSACWLRVRNFRRLGGYQQFAGHLLTIYSIH